VFIHLCVFKTFGAMTIEVPGEEGESENKLIDTFLASSLVEQSIVDW